VIVAPMLAAWALVAPSSAAAERPDTAVVTTTVTARRSLPLSPAFAAGRFVGRVEHRTLALHGRPVRGAYETVRVTDDGASEVLAAHRPAVAPQLRPADARIDAAAVPGLVAEHRGVPDAPALERPPELVYLMILGQPVLVWETQLALTLWPEPSRPTLWVSAATGVVLREEEQVRSSRARIFAQNPSSTPRPEVVELRDIHVEEAGHPLVGERVQAFNCLAEPTDEVSPWWREDECWPAQTVFSDAAGDYFVPTPDVILLEDNVAGSDPYAELSMYAHAEIFLDAMRDRGIEQFQCEFSSMLANFRSILPSDTLAYTPLNNAYYTNQCDPEKGPTMVFGQGVEVDFGYDADVIYHELGHGMVALLSPNGLGSRRERSDASLVDAGGVNEAIADYFSVMLTDDAELAEYVGRFWSSAGRPYIRDARNTKRCPDDTVGQVHNDGEPFMAALWATRSRLDDEGKAALDRSVIEALMRMPADVDLEQASALVLEMATHEMEAGSLEAEALELLRRSFDTRGLLSCPRVVTDPEQVAEDGRTLYLRRVDPGVQPFYPGPMQLRYVVPANADDLVLSYTLRARSSDDPVAAHVLVKRADAPIEFEYRLVSVDEPPLDPDPEEEDDPDVPIRELTLVTGDWDLELEATEIAVDDYALELGGLEPGEVLHLALVNVSNAEAVAIDTLVRSSAERPVDDDDDDDAPTTSAGEPTGAPLGADAVLPGDGASGCACRSAGAPGSGGGGPGWLLGALMAAAGLAARRRRGW